MKIGIDARLWNETGVGRYIRNLVEQLGDIKTTHEFVLFCLKKDQEQIKYQISQFKYPLNVRVVVSDIRWHTIAEQQKFPKIIENEQVDIMHFTYFSVPIRYLGKFVVTMHDMIPFVYSTGKASTLPLPLFKAKRVAYKFIVKKALQNAEAIIVPTHAVGNDIQKFVRIPSSKIHLTYEGTSEFGREEDPQLGLENHSYFFYVGNAYPHKNLEKLLEAFLEFSSKYSDITLVFAGKKDFFYERLLNSSATKALGNSFKYVESPTDGELKYLYKHSLSFVSASLMEGFALPALEALTHGTGVILSDIPVFKEICRDVPLAYFDPHNTRDITRAFEQVMIEPDKTRKEKIALGQKLAKSFSWHEMAERTLHVYESCLSV
jgi:glycosyltransferase involved in cell wall biosynthesis